MCVLDNKGGKLDQKQTARRVDEMDSEYLFAGWADRAEKEEKNIFSMQCH